MMTFETMSVIQHDDTQSNNTRMGARAINATRTFAGDVNLDRAVYSLAMELNMPMEEASHYIESVIELAGEMEWN